MKGSSIGKMWNIFPLPEVYNCVFVGVGAAKDGGEMLCALFVCVSEYIFIHLCVQHRQLYIWLTWQTLNKCFLIPQSTLRLPVSLTREHVCCLSEDYFIAVVLCVCSCVKLLFMWVR